MRKDLRLLQQVVEPFAAVRHDLALKLLFGARRVGVLHRRSILSIIKKNAKGKQQTLQCLVFIWLQYSLARLRILPSSLWSPLPRWAQLPRPTFREDLLSGALVKWTAVGYSSDLWGGRSYNRAISEFPIVCELCVSSRRFWLWQKKNGVRFGRLWWIVLCRFVVSRSLHISDTFGVR